MGAEKAAVSGEKRLNSWKEIASFFGCDERTVKRWETARGLPVHRVPNGLRSPVFAYESELRAWLTSHEREPAAPASLTSDHRRHFSWRLVAAGLAGLFGFGLLAFVYLTPGPSKPPSAQGPVSSAHHPNKEALAFYRAGLFEWQSRTPNGLRHAVDDFTQAIVRGPQYAQAYAGLAQCYELLREYTTMKPDYAFPRAKAAADRAIALDPSLPDAHLARAFAEFYWLHDSAMARREFQRAIALAPSSVVAHHWYATFLLEMAEYPLALAEIDRAAALDTESIAVQADKGLILFYAGRIAESRALLQRLEQTQPQFASTHRYLARVDLATHDDTGFLRELSLAATATENTDEKDIVMAGQRGLAASGRAGMLRAMLQFEEPQARDGGGSAYALATMHAELGDAPSAMIWLRESLSRGEPEITGVAIEPSFKPLRDLPEFRRLMRNAGIAPRV